MITQPYKFHLNGLREKLKTLIGIFEGISAIKNPDRKKPKSLVDYQILISPIIMKAMFTPRTSQVICQFLNKYDKTYDLEITSLEKLNGLLYNFRIASQFLEFDDVTSALDAYDL
ncbi:MAG: hypothetical protein GF364_19760, partial [Candidatus Lokiarchaeota archaeon]|nr:hypothetical protein [Candidatus Lokiarchaeota archaeon]